MAMILAFLGFGWAGVGVFNLILMYIKGDGDLAGLAALGWAINGSFFILPGLMIGVLGWHFMGKKGREQQRIDAIRGDHA